MKLTPITNEDKSTVDKWLADKSLFYYIATEPERGDNYQFGIRLNDGTLVGWANIYNVDYGNLKAEFGIAIPDQKNMRLGVFVWRQVGRFAFKELGLNRVYVRPLVSNRLAIDLDLRGGFVQEGIERQAVKRGGEFEDVVVLSMLKEEFESRWL
jgi:RimJ/RimL family protein N-acetyltransferase